MAWGSCYSPDFRVASIVGAATGTTAANDRRLVEGVAGTPTFVVDAIDTGRYAMRCVPTSAVQEIDLPLMTAGSSATAGLIARVEIAAFNNTCILFGFTGASVGSSVFLRVNATTGVLAYSLDNASTWTNSGFSFTAATVAAVEAYVDLTTSSAHILKVRVDGTEVINTTGGPAVSTAVTNGGVRFGALSIVASMQVDYADMATYNAVTQYGTIGADWRVHGLEPTVDGTHSMTTNDFQTDANVNLGNSSVSTFSLVDDAPAAIPNTTDFVKQVVTRSTSYMEWVLRAMPSGYNGPVLVCLAAAMHPVAAATANSVAFRLNSGGNVSSEAAIDTSIASNTLEYRKHHYTTQPGGAAWTAAMVNATSGPLRARFGFSGDASPPPALDSIMAFVLSPALTNQTVSPPAATASADGVDPVVPALAVPPAAATASASSPVPKLPISAPAATASVSAPVPTVSTAGGGGGAASFVADLAAAPATSTTNNTTIGITSNVTVAAGDTIFLSAMARGVTTGVATISGQPGDATVETLSKNLGTNASSVHLFRIYCPTGMSSGTTITVTWDAANTKKIAYGEVWTNVANANNQGTNGATATNAGPPTAGTTGATTTTTGVHVGAYGANFTTSPVSAVAGTDEEGAMIERADQMVGASAFGWLFHQSDVVTAAHAGGMTAPVGTVTGTIASWYGVQGVWDGSGAATNQTVSPPAATANASGPVPVPQLQIPPAAATASASAFVPVPQLRLTPAAATASASAPAPTVAAATVISPPAATASASAFVPVPQLQVPPAAATASASAPVPVPQNRIIVPLATASANGPPPTVSSGATVSPPAATSSASGLVPTPQLSLSPPAATASASAPLPTPQGKVSAPAATASASAPAPVMPIYVAGNTVILGYSNQSFVAEDIPTLERGVGRKFSGLRQNQQITTTSLSFANSDFDAGHAPASYRSIQLSTGLYTDINAGTWDTNLTTIANAIKSSGRWSPAKPFIITFMHEVGLSSNDFLGSAQDFINAFRYIRDLFDSLGATVRSKDGRYIGGPIIFAYIGWNRMFTNGTFDSPTAGKSYTDYDPDQGSSPAPAGTTYYTLCGSDPYNTLVSGSLKYGTNAADLLDDIKAQAVARGKDWMMGEMGCQDGPTSQNHLDKATWLDSLHAYVKAIVPTAPSGVCRYVFTTQEDGGLYNWDSSPDALAAGSRLALDPYFLQNSATAFGNTPTFGPLAPLATAAASAFVPTIQVSVPVPAATANASALVPTVSSAPIVSPPVATANASSPVSTIQLRVSPAAATANASAPTPVVTSAPIVSPPAATASALAPTPTVQLRVSPSASTANASAPLPAVQLLVSPGAATASASAPVPTLTPLPGGVTVSAPAATASASAPVPAVQVSVAAPAATASASSLTPVPQIRVSSAVASANASAPLPAVGVQVLPPAGIANASAPVPTLQDRVSPLVATASASALVPAIQLRVSPPVGAANASALAPTPQVKVLAPAALASASAPAPTVSGLVHQIVLPPVATANASAPVPTVSAEATVSAPVAFALASAPIPGVVVKQWTGHTGSQWPEHDYTSWPPTTSARWTTSPELQWPPDSDDQW